MSSREIADVVEPRHDSVKRAIDRLIERGVIAQPPMVERQEPGENGRSYTIQVYHVIKRDSYVVVAQVCPEFTARLVDRWQELEAEHPNSSNQSEAARAWANAQEKAQIAQREARALECARVQAVDQRDHAQEVTGSYIYKCDGKRAK